MNILILGGDGFLGSHLIDKINLNEHSVTVFDRFRYNRSINLEHIKDKIEMKSGEFSNEDSLRDILKNKDIIYHFISSTSPSTTWNAPIMEIEENLKNSIKLFELAAAMGVKKIVFASSGGTVYGNNKELPLKENSIPRPFAPYAITKLAIEHFLHHFHIKTKIAYDVYRIANPYGPRQPMNSKQGVIAVWMDLILKNQEISVFGNDKTIRDYIYVEDVAYLLTNSINDIISSDVYNIGSNESTSIINLLKCFVKKIDIPFKYQIYEKRDFDNSAFVLDSSKIYSKFKNFAPIPLEEGLSETWKYFKEKYINHLY